MWSFERRQSADRWKDKNGMPLRDLGGERERERGPNSQLSLLIGIYRSQLPLVCGWKLRSLKTLCFPGIDN